ncbi:glycine cleavage system protein GcvH [uncultured Tessaracoccus sp.]|uniref:glycine cleavage system protein GcvH n=1 Tax=uncultured Tessaracoccus sp. TaxID=905023 RepID=UPI0026242F6A|nr:glycine cleavage system protein GcvH [uncultured Tessaracoccus sp.]
MIKYTEDHEWLAIHDDVATVGITAHAAEQLGDIIFIELPEEGTAVAEGDEIVVIESVKAASDITAPVSGTIVEANTDVVDDPASVNDDAMSAWFFKIKLDDPSIVEGFMDEDAYEALIS